FFCCRGWFLTAVSRHSATVRAVWPISGGAINNNRGVQQSFIAAGVFQTPKVTQISLADTICAFSF
ncbi:MAG: hypothetical protein ACKOCH_26205, partial [Bacteroidota bacterium]